MVNRDKYDQTDEKSLVFSYAKNRKELVYIIQHNSGKYWLLSVKNEARKTTAIRGCVIRKDSKQGKKIYFSHLDSLGRLNLRRRPVP